MSKPARTSGRSWLCLVILATACNPVFHPDTEPPSAAVARGAGFAEITYRTADGLTLSALHREAAGGLPTIVYFHGNAGHHGHRAGLIQPYLDAGYGVLLSSYRGYGGNPGSPAEAGLYTDGRAALDWLAANRVPPSRTVLYGESLGTGVAVQMAVERPVAAIVLQSPFTSVVDVGEDAVPWLPVSLLLAERFDSLSKIAGIRAPLLLIHGEADRVVPVRFGRQLFAAAPEPKTGHFVPGAGHNDLGAHGIDDVVLEFLATL